MPRRRVFGVTLDELTAMISLSEQATNARSPSRPGPGESWWGGEGGVLVEDGRQKPCIICVPNACVCV